jgi:hypothetical protein
MTNEGGSADWSVVALEIGHFQAYAARVSGRVSIGAHSLKMHSSRPFSSSSCRSKSSCWASISSRRELAGMLGNPISSLMRQEEKTGELRRESLPLASDQRQGRVATLKAGSGCAGKLNRSTAKLFTKLTPWNRSLLHGITPIRWLNCPSAYFLPPLAKCRCLPHQRHQAACQCCSCCWPC